MSQLAVGTDCELKLIEWLDVNFSDALNARFVAGLPTHESVQDVKDVTLVTLAETNRHALSRVHDEVTVTVNAFTNAKDGRQKARADVFFLSSLLMYEACENVTDFIKFNYEDSSDFVNANNADTPNEQYVGTFTYIIQRDIIETPLT